MIAVDAVLPDEQPRAARDQNRRNHCRMSHAIGQTTRRHCPGDKRETQKWDRVRQQPRQPHRFVSEQPRCAERRDYQAESAEAFLAARATEECPPNDEGHGEDERDHHALSEAFDSGDDGFNTESREPLQRHGDDAGPYSQGFCGRHAPLYFRAAQIVPAN